MHPETRLCEPVIFAERQIVNPVAGELVRLIETGKAAIRGDIEWILRHHHAAATDRGRVIK